MMPQQGAREGLSLRSRAAGPFPSGAPELASIFGGGRCALGRAGVDRCPRPRGRGHRPHLSLDPGGAAPLARRMRSASPSAPPEPEPRGSRELSDSTPGRGTGGLEITGPGFLRPALGRGLPAESLPSPRSLETSTHRSGPSPAPSRGTNLRDCYPAWPTARGSGERAAPAATAATSILPPGRGPRAPSSGLHNSLPPRARTHGLNRVAQPTCSLFSAAITCPGSRGSPGALQRPAVSRLSPGPTLGRRESGRPAPCRPPGHTPGPALARRPRRRSAGEREPDCPACPPAPPPPARSLRRGRCALSASPSLFSFSFASSEADVGKPAPAAGDHRELKQETLSGGENPGGVERSEGSCWNLSGSTPLLGLSKVPAPPLLAPIPQPGPAPGSPPPLPNPPAPVRSVTSSSPSDNTDHPWAVNEIDSLPS